MLTLNKGKYTVSPQWPNGRISNLKKYQRETIDGILGFYGKMSSQELSDLTHREKPWREARLLGQSTEITRASMSEYYGSLGA